VRDCNPPSWASAQAPRRVASLPDAQRGTLRPPNSPQRARLSAFAARRLWRGGPRGHSFSRRRLRALALHSKTSSCSVPARQQALLQQEQRQQHVAARSLLGVCAMEGPVRLEASVGGALCGCGGLACLFVGGLYLLPARIRRLPYADPRQVRARFLSTALTCAVAPLALLLWRVPADEGARGRGVEAPSLAALIGLRSEGLLSASVLPLASMVSLFAGSLLDLALLFRSRRRAAAARPQGEAGKALSGAPPAPPLIERLDELAGDLFPGLPASGVERWRNLAVAPLAEELVFRSCMGALLRAAGWSTWQVVAVSPLFFGVAHLHHVHRMVSEGSALSRALLVAAVQMTYTSFFGALEMAIFMRTAHLAPIVLAHSWCNLTGLPSLSFLDRRQETWKHRYAVAATYVAGIAVFILSIGPATDPARYGNTWFINNMI
jgi:prenyl protein peptidase